MGAGGASVMSATEPGKGSNAVTAWGAHAPRAAMRLASRIAAWAMRLPSVATNTGAGAPADFERAGAALRAGDWALRRSERRFTWRVGIESSGQGHENCTL